MQVDRGSISQGQLTPLVFGQDALAASQSGVALPVAIGEGSQAVTSYTAPFDFAIVGISLATSAAATAGNASVDAAINGAELVGTRLAITTQTKARKTFLRNQFRGKAGDSIGAELTTAAGWDGTAADLSVVLWVVFFVRGI